MLHICDTSRSMNNLPKFARLWFIRHGRTTSAFKAGIQGESHSSYLNIQFDVREVQNQSSDKGQTRSASNPLQILMSAVPLMDSTDMISLAK